MPTTAAARAARPITPTTTARIKMVRPAGPRRRARPVRLAGSGAPPRLARAAPKGRPPPTPRRYFPKPWRCPPAGSRPGSRMSRGPPSRDPPQPGCSPSLAGRRYPRYQLGSCLLLQPQQGIKILSWIESIEVIEVLANADKFHRHRKLSFDTKHNARPAAAVPFRHRHPGQPDRLLEHLDLLCRVLPDLRVEHRQH